MSGHSYKPTHYLGTATAGTLNIAAPASTGQRILVGGAFGGVLGNPFVWELKDGTAIVQSGFGLAGSDAGFSDGSEVEMTPGGSASLVVSVNGGSTSTIRASLKHRVAGANL